MKLKAKHKGFTLIELLVAVAIIGILAATILASLGQARGKAKLARASSEVSSMRAAAELAANGGDYPATLFTDSTSGMKNLVDSVTNAYTSALVVKAVTSTSGHLNLILHKGITTVLTLLGIQVRVVPSLMRTLLNVLQLLNRIY